MSTLIPFADGSFTGASTFAAAEIGANALTLIRNTTTTIAAATTVTSSSFTVTNAKVIDAILLYVKLSGSGATGTFKVDLQKGGVSQASVTINKADLPPFSKASFPVQPVLFKLTSTATGDGGANWTIVITTTGVQTVTIATATSTTTNYTRALRTTTAATAAAGDDIYVLGELTGAGTHNTRALTMDSTTATAYGNGAKNSTTVAGGNLWVSCYASLVYGTSGSTNYILRVAGDIHVGWNGTLSAGASGAEIPRSSSAALECVLTAAADFGLNGYDFSTVNLVGLSRTVGKNISRTTLTADFGVATAELNLIPPAWTVNNGTIGLSWNDPTHVTQTGQSYTENSSNTTHFVSDSNASAVSNTTQTAWIYLERGSGTHNRFVRAILGSSASVAPTNGFFVDIDLQAGTVGTVTAIGNGTATSANIFAFGGGYVIKMVGKVSSANSSQVLVLAACSASGTTSYLGDGTQCFLWTAQFYTTGSLASSFTVNVANDTGWLNGDIVAIAGTARSANQYPDPFVLDADAGASSFSTSMPPVVQHHATAPTVIQAHAVLITRNVVFRSTNPQFYTYVWLQAGCTFNGSWAQFSHIGTTNGSPRYGIEIEINSSACSPKVVDNCSCHDGSQQGSYAIAVGGSGSGAFANSTVSNNIIFHTAEGINTSTNLTGVGEFSLTGNVIIGSTTTAFGISSNTAAGTITDNIVANCGSSVYFAYQLGSSTVDVSNFNNNIAYAIGGAGFVNGGSSSMKGTILNYTSIRCSGNGIQNSSTTADLWFENITSIGNGTNFSWAGGILNMRGSNVICGDAVYATGVGLFNVGLFGILDVVNLDCSGTGTGQAPHTTNDVQFSISSPVYISGTINNSKLPTGFNAKTAWTSKSYIGMQKFGQVAGDHRTEMPYGQLKTDSVTFGDAAPSMLMTPSSATNKLESAPKGKGVPVFVDNGVAKTVSAAVRKSALYNGTQPRLVQRANPALGQNNDVVLDTMTVAVGNTEILSAVTSTPTDDGVFEVIIDCDGTAGGVNVDDWDVAA